MNECTFATPAEKPLHTHSPLNLQNTSTQYGRPFKGSMYDTLNIIMAVSSYLLGNSSVVMKSHFLCLSYFELVFSMFW